MSLLVDPSALLLNAPVFFGPAGSISFPVDRREPALAGQALYVQAFDLQMAAGTGGLELLFIL